MAKLLSDGCSKCKLEDFCFLTEISANINIRNTKNDTDLQFSTESNSVNIMKTL
jgi:hypothetical protein